METYINMVNSKYTVLSLPIEIKYRELYGKLLLATMASKNGWFVLFGSKKQIRSKIENMCPGVHIEISIPESKYDQYLLKYTQLGYKISAICEESVIYPNGKDYCDRKVGQNNLEISSLFFTTGKRHANHINKYRDTQLCKIITTGNSRFDVLRPKFRNVYNHSAKKIKDKFGKFILVNTNFALCNPHDKHVNRLEYLKKKKYLKNKDQISIWKGLYNYKLYLMNEFKGFIPKIASKFDVKVIIRPHPSENHNAWEKWANLYNNIHVIYEGSSNEWMLAADAIIHNGCTTGIEGFLLDRPVITYLPISDSELSNNVANYVSFQVTNENELLIAVEKAVTNGQMDLFEDREKKLNKLKYYIENVNGPLASEIILNELNKLNVPKHSLSEIITNLKYKKPKKYFRLSNIKSNIKRLQSILELDKKSGIISKQKIPDISINELKEAINLWKHENIINFTPSIKKLGNNLFCIYSK